MVEIFERNRLTQLACFLLLFLCINKFLGGIDI